IAKNVKIVRIGMTTKIAAVVAFRANQTASLRLSTRMWNLKRSWTPLLRMRN
ncbi:hypothetical protein FRC12_015143, partial [Ceratobasidium sp. 428]